MSSTTTLKAVLLGQDRSMGKTFDSAGRDAERAGKKVGGLGSVFAGLGGPVGIGLAAVAGAGVAVAKLSGFLGDAVAEGREAARVGKTTNAIITSTGGAAKVTAEQVGDLSERLSEKAGIDDEVIQTGANLLLTFKNVRNEVGKGNQVFDRATAAAVDLSAAGFGSVDSASKMLGKALNDPLKGLSALGRAGVTFTSQQKEQIKTLVESGDVLGAQKLILAEVESQVGGVAAASADMGDKVAVSWGNLKEDLGAKLLPVLDRLGGWFLEEGIPALEKFGGWVSDEVWPALKEGYQTILPGVKEALAILTGGVDGNGISWKKMGEVLTQKVIPFVSTLFRVYLPALAAQLRTVIEGVKIAWRYFEIWRDVAGRVLSFIIGAFNAVTRVWAGVLRALGNVPGFGWARDAANKLDRAADQAGRVADNLSRIKSKSVTVSIHYKATHSGRFEEAPTGYTPGKAAGGPTVRGATYLVGENGPELLTMGGSGHITPARQTAAVLAGRSATDARRDQEREVLQPIQLLLDGRVVWQSFLRLKASGVNLGLA
ncbi:hypothetical protein ACK8HX_02055 [Oryzobacter sp. R7]|uniref:hypothetical protein n=1 Tax=Oryzobacter faecalis TaxID=3388656 RepID=UPI00398C87C4